METHRTRPIARSVFNLNRADIEQLKTDISRICLKKWEKTEDKWHQLKKETMASLNGNVPKTKVTNKNSPSWIDLDVIEMSNCKHSALQKAIRNNSSINWNEYKSIQNRLKNLVSTKYKDFIRNISLRPKSYSSRSG